MLMKKLGKYLGITLLLAWVVCSCIKEDFSSENNDSASVTVKLDTRAEDSQALANEGIESVRLILVQDGKIAVNEMIDFTKEANKPLLEKGITLLGIKAGATDFYAVVNETNNVEYNFSGIKVGEPWDKNFNPSLTVFQGKPYPTSNSEISLPMYGEKPNESIEDNKTITIDVTRAVARIDLNIVNKTGDELTLNEVSFNEFFPNAGFLVSSEGKEFTYSAPTFDKLDKNIPVSSDDKGTKAFTCYLYESLKDPKTYKIGLKLNGKPYEKQEIQNFSSVIDKLDRNTILSITATINKKDEGTCAEITCSVKEWDVVKLPPTFE